MTIQQHASFDSSAAELNATSKLVKAWESKNAKNAAKAGGVSLMALSLAACGGSSTPVADAPAVADPVVPVVPVVDAAQTFTLTKDVIDIKVGGSGDDTLIGDAATTTAADSFDGGAGNDTVKMYGTLTTPVVANVENVYFNAITGVVDLSSKSFTKIEFDAAATTHATAVDTVTVGAGQSVTLDSITDGDATDEDGADSGNLAIASAAAVTSLALTFDDVGGDTDTTAGADLEIDVAGTGVTAITVASTGAANYVGFLNAGSALKTITVTGDQLLDAHENALTTVTTIDASATTGGVEFNTTGGTQDLTFKGGAGDDTLNIGAGLDADDTLSFGAGSDTLILTAAALTSATNVQVVAINAITDVERVLSNTSAGDGVAIDFSKLTSVSNAGVVAVTPATNAVDNADGDNALTITELTSADTIVIGGNVVGGIGQKDAAGGDAINISTATNGGNDTASLLFTAAANVTGGASISVTDDSATAHAAGDGLAADTVENIVITTADKDADVVFAGGSNAADATNDIAGASVTVGANGTVTISGAGDVNLGTVVSAAGVSADDLTIDGSGMTGILTVTTGVGNDTITGGSKADVINAGSGANTITTGGGVDKVTVADGASSLTAMTSITDFTAGAGGDTLDFTGATLVELSAAAKTAIAADTTLAAAVAEATGTGGADGANEIVGFTFGGNNYVVFNHAATAGFDVADGDNIINLGDTDYTILHADNFV